MTSKTNDRLSVVHVTNHLGLGGTQKAMEVLARGLDPNQFDVAVIGVKSDGERGHNLRADGYQVDIPDSMEDLRAVLREHETDVVHLHGMYDTGPKVVEMARSLGVPVVVKTTPFGRVNDEELSDLDLVLFPSRMTMFRELRLGHWDIESNGWHRIFHQQYYPLSSDDVGNRVKEDLRDELGIAQETPVVGKIGRSSAAKWSNHFIDAFERVCRAIPEAKLLLVTPPKKIKRDIRRQGIESNVVYLDRIEPSNVGSFYNTIDVLTHASAIGESFGYVIAEAMAYSTPVVVDSNPMRDNAQVELVNNGETGFVVGGAEAYADATVELLRSEQKRRHFGEAGRERAVRLLNPKPIVAEMESIYTELAGADETSGDSVKSLNDQREHMSEFEREYDRRLRDVYGPQSAKYRFERLAWTVCSRAPIGRRSLYRQSQGLFKDI